jgi:diguanylate cyclase (GGDEF)-like protein
VRLSAALPPEVSHELSRRALQQAYRYGLVGLGAPFGLMASLWSGIDHRRAMVWVGVDEALVLLALLISARGARAESGRVRRWEWAVGADCAVQGLLLAALPLIVPIRGGSACFALWLANVIAFAAGNVLLSGASLLLFVTYQVPLLTVAAGVVIGGGSGLPALAGVLVLPFLAMLLLGRVEQIAALSGGTLNARRAEQLAADLVAERDQTLAANERLAQTVAELESASQTLAHQASHDLLTGLPNRERFLEHLTLALARSCRSGRQVAVLYLDLDRFKIVNDARGHALGDTLLRVAADRVHRAVRAGDVVARHGGDEFTVLVPDIRSVDEAVVVAERLRAVLSEPFDVDGEQVTIGASVGIALNGQATDGAEDLLRHADVAVHRAKDLGRNRVELFDESLRTSIRRRLSDEAELRAAIAAGQIVPWFQPVVDMRNGRIVGAEALARWIHPERGVLLPAAFLPLVLESDLTWQLGESIVQQVVALRHRIAPLVASDFPIAVNLAPKDMSLDEIFRACQADVERRGVDPRGITLEITETTVIKDPAAARESLAWARSLGFAVALDDFGTGYSALSLVRDLPLDVLKIDRSFVRGMAVNPADDAVVAAVLDLARRLGLKVIAEGVEDDADVARLLDAGAQLAQGFRYSPAVPGEEFESWLRVGPPWSEAAGSGAPQRLPGQRRVEQHR